MAVTNLTTEVSEYGNGAKVAFDFAFKILAATDLVVYKELTAGVFTLQNRVETLSDPVVANEYTLDFDTDAEIGTVTYSVAVLGGASPMRSIIRRATAHTQGTSFPREGNMPGKTVELTHDKAELQIQEIHTILGRALLQPAMPLSPDPIEVDPLTDRRALIAQDNDDGTWTLIPSTYDPDAQVLLAIAQVALATAQAVAAAASAVAAAVSAAAALASQIAAAASAAAALVSENNAAASAALSVGTSGLIANRPVGGASRLWYYATDDQQQWMWDPAAGRWFLIG